jgi:4-hydroxythreonine-4-phosphate dehydrogenase
MKPLIAITIGDFNGIGPEIVLKSINSKSIQAICTPVLIGPLDAFEFYAHRLRIKLGLQEIDSIPFERSGNYIPVYNTHKFYTHRIKPGLLSADAGKHAGEAIKVAVKIADNNLIDGIVTAPVSKEALYIGGYSFPGQTEMLGTYFGISDTLMMFAGKKMKIGLATTHLPISKISSKISKPYFFRKIQILNSSLKNDFKIKLPKIAVLGLNPHAGERGLIGYEEKNIIIPAIKTARKKRINVDGPFPADAFFGVQLNIKYDAILASYHDQGLIPFKMLYFHNGVNITAGLPIVRTSPDHGTAFEIAGKGIANPSSMIEAIRMARQIIINRKSLH